MRLRRLRRGGAVIGVLSVMAFVAGCTADPPPPIEQPETTTPTTGPSSNQPVTVAVGIEEVPPGFNPHLLGDQSPVADAVASAVLPSAFRPVPGADRPGALELDAALLKSAEVTNEAPFTVTYTIRNDAQWSDSAPIAAEDFRYLWEQMIAEPGVVDPAGYRLIDDVRSSGGGKTVTVVMREPYPAWRELFSDLLPSHLVKDTPGGFATALSETIAVSGASFKVRDVDRGRGEVLLERNDRYWATPAVPDRIALRRAGTAAQVADSMRTDDTQVTHVRAESTLSRQLDTVPGVRTATVPVPRVLEVTANTRTPDMGDLRVRRGVLGLLDPDLLAEVSAGSASDVLPARAQILAPSEPGYRDTAPAAPGRDAALADLAAAGYLPDLPPGADRDAPETATTGTLARDGVPLAVVIGVPEDSPRADTVARTASDQLRDAGIHARVEQYPADELYGSAVVDGDVDLVIGWVRGDGDGATRALSRFGCLPAGVDGRPETEGADPETGTPTDEDGRRRALVAAPSNVSGVCDPALQSRMTAALSGRADLEGIEPALWDLAATLPVAQDRAVVAVGPGVEGAEPSPTLFTTAATWKKVNR